MTTGIVVTVLGLAMILWVSRQEFRRRNEFGVQEFSSYSSKLASQGMERVVLILGRLLSFVGLVIVGLHWLFHT